MKLFLAIAIVLAVTVAAFVAAADSDAAPARVRASNRTRQVIVAMHGLDSTAPAMDAVLRDIKEVFPDAYVKSAEIVNGKNRWDSFFIPMNEQVRRFHEFIMRDPVLREGDFVVAGHSQGGVLLLGWLTKYSHLMPRPPRAFISWAGVVHGVSAVPDVNYYCPTTVPLCDVLPKIMSELAAGKWSPLCQLISFCDYWYPQFFVDEYLARNTFLPVILNEGAVKNATHRSNMLRLRKVLLLKSGLDRIVVPPESEHFGRFANNSYSRVLSMEETEGYQKDWIGLRTLNEAGRIRREVVPCGHQDAPSKKRCPESFKFVIETLKEVWA